jgi:hypothetical protein
MPLGMIVHRKNAFAYALYSFTIDPTSPGHEDCDSEWEDEEKEDYQILSFKFPSA